MATSERTTISGSGLPVSPGYRLNSRSGYIWFSYREGDFAGTATIAQLTKLGWIVTGPTDAKTSSNTLQEYHVSVNQDFYQLLHRFWELEEIPSFRTSSLSAVEQECENHFKSTLSR